MGIQRTLIVVTSLGLVVSGSVVAGADETNWLERSWSRLDLLGYVKNETAFRLDDPTGPSEFRNIFNLEATLPLSRTFELYGLTRNWYDGVFDLTDRYSADAEDEYRWVASIREVRLDAYLGCLDLRIGRQQVVWGEAIGLRITDVVNPQDWREFILEDYIYSRIPLWMVKASYYAGYWEVEGLWIPFFEADQLAERGSEWAFATEQPDPGPGVALVVDDVIEPEMKLENGEFALRLSGFWKGWDLSGSYFYTWDDAPAIHTRFDPNHPVTNQPAVTITPEHHRLHIIGATFARPASSWVFRGEFAYYVDRFFETEDRDDTDGVVRKNYLYYMVSAEYSGYGNAIINGQLVQRVLFDYKSALTEDAVLSIASFNIRLDFLHETLRPTLLALYSFNDQGFWINPEVEYDLTDRIILAGGFDLLGGEADGFLGQFGDNDRIYGEVKYGF